MNAQEMKETENSRSNLLLEHFGKAAVLRYLRQGSRKALGKPAGAHRYSSPQSVWPVYDHGFD